MDDSVKRNLLESFDPWDNYSQAPVREKVNGSALSLKERTEVAQALGATYCSCLIPVHLAPGGYCPDCETQGPLYQDALDYSERVKKARVDEISFQYKPVNWHEAFQAKPSEVDWLFPPIIEAGTLNVLFGLPGVGKSLLVLDMVLDILREGRKVLVLDEENRVNEVVERMEKFGISRPDDLENLIWFSFPQLPPLDTPRGGEHLTALVDDYKPDLIIMDTTTRMVEGDENSSNTWLQLYRCSLVPIKLRGIAVLRLDHQGKDPTKGQRGSSAKDGDVDTIWRLKFSDGGMFALEREKSRSRHGEDWILVERMQDPLRHVFKELDHMPVTPRIEQWAANFDRWGIPRDAGRPTLRAALQERTAHDDGISTTLLAAVARYRKSQAKGLDSPDASQ